MPKLSQTRAHSATPNGPKLHRPRPSGAGSLFGVPLGDLGWFSTLLMSIATGFAAFFAATFFGIIGILLYQTVGHHGADFAISYRKIGLPFGVLFAVLALSYLGSLWIRRQLLRS